MLEHHLQKETLHKLVLTPSARYADLKPADVDGNVFTYHLHQLEKQKLIIKTDDGKYQLTALGKAAGINILLSAKELLEQAHPVLFMAARNDQGAWLLRRRLAQPTFGRYGFVHGEPCVSESIADTATRVFQEKTGLQADFSVRGSGFIKIFAGDELESYTQFTLLLADHVSGELQPKVGNGENAWLQNPDFQAGDMIPSMADICEKLQTTPPNDHFFVEKIYKL